jgi:Preprotein translocase subunit SecF
VNDPSEEDAAPQEEAAPEEARVETVSEQPSRREPRVRKLDIVSRRNWFFLVSLIIIIPGIFFMATRGFLLGIDFAGGTEFTLTFTDKPSLQQVQAAVVAENIDGTAIPAAGDYIIRAKPCRPSKRPQSRIT